jgi:hypothetical protein
MREKEREKECVFEIETMREREKECVFEIEIMRERESKAANTGAKCR